MLRVAHNCAGLSQHVLNDDVCRIHTKYTILIYGEMGISWYQHEIIYVVDTLDVAVAFKLT